MDINLRHQLSCRLQMTKNNSEHGDNGDEKIKKEIG
jgi:hypothetical protein